MCFGMRILSQFHLATPIVYIQNLNCPKNAKNASADKIFGMIFHTMYDTCEMLNLSSQQEISYILLSVTNNIHLYHLPTSCWINHQNTGQFCTTSPVGILLGCCWDFVGMTIQGPKIVGMDPNHLHPKPRPSTPQDLFESIIFLYQNEMFWITRYLSIFCNHIFKQNSML